MLEVFDEWSPGQVQDSLRAEPIKARLYRAIASSSGTMNPLNEKHYKKGMQKHNGNEEEFQARISMKHPERLFTGYQLHSRKLPLDAYQLFQESRWRFLLFLVALYFVLLMAIFAFLGWGVGCFNRDITPVNFFPMGFLLLSGKFQGGAEVSCQ